MAPPVDTGVNPGKETPDEDGTGEADSTQAGQLWKPWWLIVAGALVIVMGIGVFFVVVLKICEKWRPVYTTAWHVTANAQEKDL